MGMTNTRLLKKMGMTNTRLLKKMGMTNTRLLMFDSYNVDGKRKIHHLNQ
jgi:hypothetical protein